MSTKEGEKTVYQTILSKETLMPISFLIVIIGVAMWAVTIANGLNALDERESSNILDVERRIEQNSIRITNLESQNAGLFDRMARIETKLDIIIDTFNR